MSLEKEELKAIVGVIEESILGKLEGIDIKLDQVIGILLDRTTQLLSKKGLLY